MRIEGQLLIQLHPHKTGGECVKISSTRPVHAAKILVGKTPEQALSIVPLLFSVCGVAQSRASLSALQQIMHVIPKKSDEHARDLLVLCETAKEHLLRILIDWPKLFTLESTPMQLSYLGSMLNNFKHALYKKGDAFSFNSQLDVDTTNLSQQIENLETYLNKTIFDTSPSSWLDIKNIDQLRQWAESTENSMAAYSLRQICEHSWTSQGYSTCTALPPLSNEQLIQQLDANNADHFIEQPTWQGCYHETNSLSRQAEHPLIKQLHLEFDNCLITRWTARLVELALIPQQMRELQLLIKQKNNVKNDSKQLGLAQVEAARGRLIHRAQLQKNKNNEVTISRYQIVAPTEWNFHPQGLIHQSLSHIKAQNVQEHEQLARLVINAIDPCVAYQLSVH